MGGEVLVSGAGVAGPVLAFWLHRLGFTPTVVERVARPRLGTGGHAVDLFAAAVDVVDRMGLLGEVEAARTRTETLRVLRAGRRPVEIRVADLIDTLTADRHVEVMRGELARVLLAALPDDVEVVHGDSVRTLRDGPDGVEVTFEHGPARRFDLVVGADGLHSAVRRLVFGEEARFRRFLGGYLAAFTLPGAGLEPGVMTTVAAPDRIAGTYPVWQTGEARALFLFRTRHEAGHDHRDPQAQKRLLREVYAGDGGEVARLLAGMDGAEDFYLDSISQIRMPTWSRGRVTLVGDAGYSPGPAVGGGTTLAVVGAYTLAHHLAAADGDPAVAFPACEDAMRDLVLGTRAVGPEVMRTIVPGSPTAVRLLGPVLSLTARLPAPLRRRLTSRASASARVLGRMRLPEVGVGSR